MFFIMGNAFNGSVYLHWIISLLNNDMSESKLKIEKNKRRQTYTLSNIHQVEMENMSLIPSVAHGLPKWPNKL